MAVSPPAPAHEEWTCRDLGTSRHWFYRSWFHSYTIAWGHLQVGYVKQAFGPAPLYWLA